MIEWSTRAAAAALAESCRLATEHPSVVWPSRCRAALIEKHPGIVPAR